MSTTSTTPAGKPAPKLGHVRILEIAWLKPSPENDSLYRPVNLESPDMQALVQSIRQHGVKEPLVVTEDGWILSGHRRHAAAQAAGLKTVPCRFEPIRRLANLRQSGHGDVNPEFLSLLREYNRQREKTLAEKLREEVVSADPEESYANLLAHRRQAAQTDMVCMDLPEARKRARITAAKEPFLQAILDVLEAMKKYLPISERAIHYRLLNTRPLIHASKPGSKYSNTKESSKALSELLTRARIVGRVPMNVIADETRPVTTWNVWRDAQDFIRKQLDGFLRNYWRDVLQSQPNHLEIIGEKLALEPIIRPVAAENCLPYTLGRGYCSVPPRWKMAERYRRSGKEKLILLVLSDHDPDGVTIGESFARSMRDDFAIDNIEAVKVAVTYEQTQTLDLPPALDAKPSSTQYRQFVRRYGTKAYELEALPPDVLQEALREAIDNAIHPERFNAQLDAERADAAFLASVRGQVLAVLKEMRIEGFDGDQDEGNE